MTRRCDQQGFVSAEWVAAVGFLLIPMFVLVATLSRVPEMQAAAQTIATESARAGAQANSCAEAKVAAQRVVRSENGSTGLAKDLGADFDREDYTGTDWRAGGTFRVTSHVKMPLVIIPGGPDVKLPLTLSASHTEPIDKYRFLDETPCPS